MNVPTRYRRFLLLSHESTSHVRPCALGVEGTDMQRPRKTTTADKCCVLASERCFFRSEVRSPTHQLCPPAAVFRPRSFRCSSAASGDDDTNDATKTSAKIPNGSWPCRMAADLAAGYCGEPTLRISETVGEEYPNPRVKEGRRRYADRGLDNAIAPRHLPIDAAEDY